MLFPAIPQFRYALGPPIPQQVQRKSPFSLIDLQDQQAGRPAGANRQVNLDPIQPQIRQLLPPELLWLVQVQLQIGSVPDADDRLGPTQSPVAAHMVPQLAVVIQVLFAIQDVANLILPKPDGKLFGNQVLTL
jgi:hypothetical protein